MRKSEIITLTDNGEARRFRITQMPATKAERWINRVMFLLTEASKKVKLPKRKNDEFKVEDAMQLLSVVDYDKVEPLYNELIECCSYLPHGNEVGIQCSQDTIDAQIEDPLNLYRLRMASARLNFDFFMNALQSAPQIQNTITFKKNTRT